MSEKVTKRDNYMYLRNMVMDTMGPSETQNRLLAFIDREVELLDLRSQKSKDYQAKHKATNDAMTDMIIDVLSKSSSAMTIPDIVAKIVDSTPQKITYRLGKLFQEGKIEKNTQTVKIEGSNNRRLTFYSMTKKEV